LFTTFFCFIFANPHLKCLPSYVLLSLLTSYHILCTNTQVNTAMQMSIVSDAQYEMPLRG